MGEDGKRKTRRGKRGGDAKKQKDIEASTETVLPASSTAPSTEYTAPPMDSGDSLFYFDTGSKDENTMNVDKEDKISPASYGLVNPDLQSYLKNCETMLDDPKFESIED
ncbi:hypothetical protein LPJ58_003152, partial [Coemansia sp. RSA 1591]